MGLAALTSLGRIQMTLMNRLIPQTKYNPTTRQIPFSLGRNPNQKMQKWEGGLRDTPIALGIIGILDKTWITIDAILFEVKLSHGSKN